VSVHIAARRSTFSGDERLKHLISEECQQFDVWREGRAILPDQVHLLVSVDPAYQRGSSRILRQEYPSLRTRMPERRTNSYFVATTGGAPIEVIKHSIQEQKRVEEKRSSTQN
jgi:putative transposase